MKEQARTIGKRWDCSAAGYSDIIQKEFEETGGVWTRLLLDNAPAVGKKALDIGTGPGFFAMLLAMNGYEVTGVDCSEEMILQARRNAVERDLTVEFRVMDSHDPDFPDNSFDYIVLRNATWPLFDTEKALSEWLRVLRPGGRLMYVDANWPYVDDPELTRKLSEAYARYEQANGKAFDSYTGNDELIESADRLSRFAHILRPGWDRDTLPKLGYCHVNVIPRVNETIYPRWKQELYDCMDEFLVTADKPE